MTDRASVPGFRERHTVNGGDEIDTVRRDTQLDDSARCRGVHSDQAQTSEAEIGQREEKVLG